MCSRHPVSTLPSVPLKLTCGGRDVKLVPVAGVLAAKNEFRKRDTLDRAAKAAKGVTKSRASASVKESCGYFLDFDVPAVLVAILLMHFDRD